MATTPKRWVIRKTTCDTVRRAPPSLLESGAQGGFDTVRFSSRLAHFQVSQARDLQLCRSTWSVRRQVDCELAFELS